MEQGKDNSLYPLLAQSDYILISTPLTDETRGMMDAQAFSHVKPGAVLINVGRGPIIDESVMIEELKPGGRLKGAALDVFAVEPLPLTSELWTLPNTLISPHNMDKTEMFMHESTDFFLNENVQRFIRNIPLLNPVNPLSGY
jgi:phosphoglycerate dehydrogenase-like enzyme